MKTLFKRTLYILTILCFVMGWIIMIAGLAISAFGTLFMVHPSTADRYFRRKDGKRIYKRDIFTSMNKL